MTALRKDTSVARVRASSAATLRRQRQGVCEYSVGATGICQMTGPPGRRVLTRRPEERERVYGVDLEEIRALRAKCTMKKNYSEPWS